MSATNCLFQFWTWRRNGIEFKPTDCDLYYCLLDSSVRFGGGEFTLSNKWLMNLLGVSLRQLQLSRERLHDQGLISYKNGSQTSTPRYEINDISEVKHPDQLRASSTIQSTDQSTVQSSTQSTDGSTDQSSETSTKLVKKKSKSKNKKHIDIFVDRTLLPESLRGDETVKALKGYLEHRRAKGAKNYTDQGLDKLLNLLTGWESESAGKAAASLDHSVLNNWVGCFEKKDFGVAVPAKTKNKIPSWKLDEVIGGLQNELLRTHGKEERERISLQIKELKAQRDD